MSFVWVWEKIDRVITAPHCIFSSPMRTRPLLRQWPASLSTLSAGDIPTRLWPNFLSRMRGRHHHQRNCCRGVSGLLRSRYSRTHHETVDFLKNACTRHPIHTLKYRCGLAVFTRKRCIFLTRGQFWPSDIVVACICLCLCVCAYVRQPWACPRDNLWPIQARIIPNLDQRCKMPLLNPLLFGEWLTLTSKAKIYPILSVSTP